MTIFQRNYLRLFYLKADLDLNKYETNKCLKNINLLI